MVLVFRPLLHAPNMWFVVFHPLDIDEWLSKLPVIDQRRLNDQSELQGMLTTKREECGI
jgi:hypothetical protein